jgi:hypothetical protein
MPERIPVVIVQLLDQRREHGLGFGIAEGAAGAAEGSVP